MHREVSALISLIEDPDEEIFTQVKNELHRYGEALIPQLEHYWEMNHYGPLFNARVEKLIHELHYGGIYKRLREWKESDQDLLDGLMILNRYQYPTESEEELKHRVMKIRQDIWLELNDFLTALEAVNVFNTVLFKIHGFKGTHHHSQGHLTLSDLLNTKRGEPLIIGALYSWIAESLDIQMPAINMPGYCILAYQEMDLEGNPEILFYVNPHDEGNIVGLEDLEQILNDLQYPQDARFFQASNRVEWMARLINAFINDAMSKQDKERIQELRALQSLLLE
jgi:regulator of sirC expression with transglutaminase-like and TPR domain